MGLSRQVGQEVRKDRQVGILGQWAKLLYKGGISSREAPASLFRHFN